MKQPDQKTNLRRYIGAAIFCAVGTALVCGLLLAKKPASVSVPYADFYKKARNGEVAEVTLADKPTLQFTLAGDETVYTTENPRNPELKEELLLQGADVSEGSAQTVNSYIQLAVSIAFFGAAFYFVSRNSGKNGFHQAMAMDVANADGAHLLKFTDVAGNDEAKDSVSDLVDFLKNPEKYAGFGARMPRGCLFYGPPGTGKTMLAKAVAGEAGVPFYAVSGSDFVQMFVGVGAGRIRDLFKKARASGKAVIFIDEIDALGKKRGGAAAGGNDERDQTLNALLTEMSGFSSTDGIIVIAATNRPDTLDEALLRPGRFDRQIEIGLPDVRARERILRHHADGKPLSNEIDLQKLAADTVYFSGAMLENLLNEAAITAAKRESGTDANAEITAEDMEKAFYTVIAGSEKKDRSHIREKDRQITAYHEAGHALAAKCASPDNVVSRVTIIPSTKGAGGFCVNIPPDKMYRTKADLEAQILISLAGRAAEELIFGAENITTGASNDIEKATGIAKDYVAKFGMSEKAGILYAEAFEKDGGMEVKNECGKLLDRMYEKAKTVLVEKSAVLKKIAEALLAKETLNGDELDEICGCA